MNDARQGASGAGHDRPDPVGSVGEEATKLLGALSDWARHQGTDFSSAAAGAADAFTHTVKDVGEHVATGGQDCRYCPVCQVIHAVRATSPEVRAHLSLAASSLVQAAAGLLATHAEGAQKSAPVERIDLETGADWDAGRDAGWDADRDEDQ